MHDLLLRAGSFFFRRRNNVFPIVVIGLFALAAPPREIFGSETAEQAKDLLALLLALGGLAIRASVIGFAYIKRGGKNKRVYAAELVTGGMFGVCRNPLYVGNIAICLGTFLMHGHPFVLIVGTAFYIFVYVAIVHAEETYLLEKFGDGYRAYCADVPRWLPKLSRFREATAGMRFKAGRVIAKDYSTIASTIALLAATEAYEYWTPMPFSFAEPRHVAMLAATIVLCGVFLVVVRSLKRRGLFVGP
jgi:protein-S-isoprenylcysteine O-methyltransferase Ste14